MIEEFARKQLKGRPELQNPEAFPEELWRQMGRAELLGLAIHASYGGLGAAPVSLLQAASALVRGGRSLGMAFAWLSHNTIAHFLIERQGSQSQRALFLPELAAGRVTASVAISEPGAGAHPKHLTAHAERVGDCWLLNGEKAYITNGPIAGLFVVLAITTVAEGRKQFTAFLVPRESPGLAYTNAGAVDFLRPARHCGLRLTNCAVPFANVLGTPGKAFETIGKPLRWVEDVLGLGLILGGMQLELDLLVEQAAGISVSDIMREELGKLRALLVGLETLAMSCGKALGDSPPIENPALLLAAQLISEQFQSKFIALQATLALTANAELTAFSGELDRLLGLGRNLKSMKQRLLGEWNPAKDK